MCMLVISFICGFIETFCYNTLNKRIANEKKRESHTTMYLFMVARHGYGKSRGFNASSCPTGI